MAIRERIEEINNLLEPKRLTFPESMPVVRIEAEEYIDFDGEDALRVTVILDESVSVEDESVTGKDINDLKDAIHDRLLENGITEFPYIYLTTESELREDIDLPG